MRRCGHLAGLAVIAALAGIPVQAKDDPVILAPNERLLVLPLEFLAFKSKVETFGHDSTYKDMEVVSITNARVCGRDGFRAELKSRLNIANTQRRERHLVYGVMGPSRAYLLRFDAPAIYYFDRHLAEFEAAVSTFELL